MIFIFFSSIILFLLAYRFYGRFLDKKFSVDNSRKTPSHTDYDGVDRVPTKPMVLFGHHFSSIAGAGPVVGPIIAAAAFGWLPALLWIVLGSIFIGGVHDYASLMASIRHKAKSVAEIAKEHMSGMAYKLFLVFIWLALVYILIVFVDLTKVGFVSSPNVASSSMIFIGLAVLFGLLLRSGRINLLQGSIIFVPLVFLGIYAGHLLPIDLSLPGLDVGKSWSIILIIYCFIASISPVWILLQPRDYLSSFLLYGSVLAAFLGIVIGGFEIKYEAFTSWSSIDGSTLFPILFITIACGACSGFHCIVASGTSSKQLDQEKHAKPVAYGAMLVEGLVAVISLLTLAMLPWGSDLSRAQPLEVYGAGIGNFLAALGLPFAIGKSFGILAVTTFLLTTLDTSTRLARYVMEEFFDMQGLKARVIGSSLTLVLPLVFSMITLRDASGAVIPAWKAVWPVFGATNQLMAGLALLIIFVWLRKSGKNTVFVLLPLIFMLTTTTWALVQLTIESGFTVVGVISTILLILSVILVFESIRTIKNMMNVSVSG